MDKKTRPLKEGKTESSERKIIPDTKRIGKTEPPEKIIKPPKKEK
jgi:hypothetical protein